MRKMLLTLAALALIVPAAYADITFSNGLWETTFNRSSDQVFNQSSPYSPDIVANDIQPGDIKAAWTTSSRCNGQNSSVSSSGNYSGGGGGRGFTSPIQLGPYNNGANGTDGYMIFTFNSGQSEYWVRWYQKFPAGKKFNHGKDIYAFTAGNERLMFHYGLYDNSTDWRRDQYGDYTCVNGCNEGVNSVEGPNGFDGQWHAYEVYIKIKGNGGVLSRFWADGVFIEEYESNSGGPTSGIKMFYMKQAMGMDGTGCASYSIDDVAIANPSYNGFVLDSRGNKMIGPIGSGGSSGGGGGGTIQVAAPSNLRTNTN